jgi:hypothetical protein
MLTKILAIALVLSLIVGGIGCWKCYGLGDSAGYNRRVAEESKAASDAETAAIKTATKENAADEVSQRNFATTTDTVHTVTFDIGEAIHAPEPPHPGQSDDQPVPDPFPAGFSVCWNAASTHNAADLAACEASRRASALPGQPAAGTGEHGHAPGDAHAGPGAPDPQRIQ